MIEEIDDVAPSTAESKRVLSKGTLKAIDKHVGSRISARRKELKLSQTQIGKSIGVIYQQIVKYESGANRVSASTLWELARSLDVPPDYFFEGMPNHLQQQIEREHAKRCTTDRDHSGGPDEDLERAIRALKEIKEGPARRAAANLLEAIAASQKSPAP